MTVPNEPRRDGPEEPGSPDHASPASARHTGQAHGPATAATVGLATAARLLGISQDAAVVLAEHDEFPCTLIRTSDGYRVPFAALLRVLRSGRGHRAGPDDKPGREGQGR